MCNVYIIKVTKGATRDPHKIQTGTPSTYTASVSDVTTYFAGSADTGAGVGTDTGAGVGTDTGAGYLSVDIIVPSIGYC